MKNKKAYTLPELLIVLTIIGIIASISMITLKPNQFKAEALSDLSKRALYDIDTATKEILISNATPISESAIAIPTSECSDTKLQALYKKYLITTNKTAKGSFAKGTTSNSFCLKSGICLGFSGNYSKKTRIPGDTSTRTAAYPGCGLIYIDINDDGSPNTLGIDQFIIPINVTGISY